MDSSKTAEQWAEEWVREFVATVVRTRGADEAAVWAWVNARTPEAMFFRGAAMAHGEQQVFLANGWA